MTEKTKYIKRFQNIFQKESGQEIPDDLALEYLELMSSLIEEVLEGEDANQLLKMFKNNRYDEREI